MSKKNKPSIAQATWLGALSRCPILHSRSVVEPAVRDACEAKGWAEYRLLAVAKHGEEVREWHITDAGRVALLRATRRKDADKPLRLGTSAALMPSTLLAFESELRRHVGEGEVDVSVDAPEDRAGTWWLEISWGTFRTSLSWQEEFGFGVFTSEEGYGDKPDEWHADAVSAARRIAELIADLLKTTRAVVLLATALKVRNHPPDAGGSIVPARQPSQRHEILSA